MDESRFTDRVVSTPMTAGIIIRRDEAGVVETNVPHLVMYHSPDGYEFGFGGSGPADLALNIVEHLLRQLNYAGSTQCHNVNCFCRAFELHQDFKWQFIAPLNQNTGGTIGYQTALNWVKERK